jgi:tripartite-type tricarboxylate transporter receptor subunit TctC
VTPSLYSKLPFDVSKDYQPIVLGSMTPRLLVVTPSQPIRSVKDLMARARARPGTQSYGGVGIGGGMHLAMAVFEAATGTKMLYVVYKSSLQVLTDVIGGQIQLAWDVLSATVPRVQAGRVRALGVTSLTRSHAIPEVPTIDEAGVLGYEFSTWGGYALPAGAPSAALLRLNAEINKALSRPSIAKVIVDRGGTPIGGTPEHFAEHLTRERVKWAGVIKAAGIKLQ